MKKSAAISARIALVFSTVGALANAESTPAQKAMASQLFDDAQALFAAQKVEAACPKYAESYHQDPQLGTLLYLGECYDRLGKTASSWAIFKDAADLAHTRQDPREEAARAKLAELEPRLPHVVLQPAAGNPPTLEVTQDGVLVGSGAWGAALPIDPGRHNYVARAEGYLEWSSIVEIRSGERQAQVVIPVLQAVQPKPQATDAIGAVPQATDTQREPTQRVTSNDAARVLRPEPAATKSTSGTQATIGWAMAGTGTAGLVAGAIFGLVSRSKLSDRSDANACSATLSCTDADESQINALTDSARAYSRAANIAFVGGGLFAAAGVFLVVYEPSRPTTDARVRISPWSSQNSGGLLLGGNW